MADVLDNVQNIGKDVAVPENPESEGSRLITLKQIELEHGVSRSALHTYRRSASFPEPVPVEGSTKTQYRAEEVAAWFEANPKQQGKKREQFVSHKQGEPVSTTVDPRIAILSKLNDPPYNTVAEKRCVPWDEAEEMLHKYRAIILQHVLCLLEASAGDATAEKLLDDNPELAEWLRVPGVQGPEPQDG
ncbi:DNA-binding protein [Streptomyces bauhiniae]|uniref:helix-turn-helix transcriptional regulator n=1 Tax=Streptomyces bauhiniae TaxID=2340725 RepID=UPI0033B073E0